MLEVKQLTKYYGDILGIKEVSFTLKPGEIFGFIGPNGAGKSTTIRSIMGLINKTAGQIIIDGKELQREDTKIKELIGYLPSEIHVYDDLTVKEMLDYHASFYSKNISKRRKELVKLLKLDEKKRVEDLSLGNLKKVGIVLSLMHEPKLLILDEPTSGLDPIMQQVFYNLLQEEKEKGTTILYSTHVLHEVSKICDRVGIIKDGHLLKIESIKDLNQKNLTYVTIVSPAVTDIAKVLKIKPLLQEEQLIKFKNTLPTNTLIQKLAQYSIDRLLIEEAPLEELFLHYY